MTYNKDEIKNALTDEQIFDYLYELGAEPIKAVGSIICRTICHNGDSHKLWYYYNTKLFKCYTECQDNGAFDIFELTRKVKNCELYEAIEFIAIRFGIQPSNGQAGLGNDISDDWNLFKTYESLSVKSERQKIVDSQFYDKDILQRFPLPHLIEWEKEGISYETLKQYNIRYNPSSHGILIPHYDADGNLIGIRQRTLIKEEEINGKYRPAVLNNKMYNHPLSIALYGFNFTKENITRAKKVILFEGEKSVLKANSYMGYENNISVACCGSSLLPHQVDLLLKQGVQEIIVAFDKQWKQAGDDEYIKWHKKLKEISNKYSSRANITFMLDERNVMLGYKDSPIDCGFDTFLALFKRRIHL